MKKILIAASILVALFGLVAIKPKLLTYLPITSELIGPAKGIISFNELKSEEQFRVIRPAETYVINGRERHIEPQTIALLKNARIYRKAGFVITKEDLVYKNNANCWDYQTIDDIGALKRLFLPRTKQFYDARVAVVAAHGGHCYYHWMFDTIVKIMLLKENNIAFDKVYLPTINKRYQRETLELVGLDPSTWIQGDDKTMIKVKEAIVPCKPSEEDGWVKKVLTPWLVQKLHDLIPDDGIEPTKNIYISRQKAHRRRILNEDELALRLQEYNFEICFLEDLSVIEQAKLLRSAKLIVTAHGAGLTNLVFAHDKIKLVEFMHPGHVDNCYEDLAAVKEMEYHRLPIAPKGGDCDGDINIDDVESLVKTLL